MKQAVFYERLENLGIDLSDQVKSNFEIYKNHLQKVNQVLNLTAIDDDEGIYAKHFYDSLLMHHIINEKSAVCDVGSGAGFPGLVLAIARPDLSITLVEPTTKRVKFLEEVVALCQLDNVKIFNDRAESVVLEHRESFDVVTARAVAYLDILSELCLPLVKVGGLFIAMKGAKAQEELDVSTKAIKLLGGEVIETQELKEDQLGLRTNIVIRKVSKTHTKYPRNYGRIKKTPLSGRKND